VTPEAAIVEDAFRPSVSPRN